VGSKNIGTQPQTTKYFEPWESCAIELSTIWKSGFYALILQKFELTRDGQKAGFYTQLPARCLPGQPACLPALPDRNYQASYLCGQP